MRLFPALAGAGLWQSTACLQHGLQRCARPQGRSRTPVQVKTAAAACAVQRFAHKVKARTALELEVLIHLPQASPPPVVWACFQLQGVRPLKRQCLAVWASFCHCAAVSTAGASLSCSPAADHTVRPSFWFSRPARSQRRCPLPSGRRGPQTGWQVRFRPLPGRGPAPQQEPWGRGPGPAGRTAA